MVDTDASLRVDAVLALAKNSETVTVEANRNGRRGASGYGGNSSG